MSAHEKMNLCINGRSQVPPGFRFHPTEEELLHYYLRKKVAHEKIDLDVIRDVDLNKLEPWDIQEKCKIGSGPQSDWYFFSHKDKKYPTGTRTNRATIAGFWKATGRDKTIYSGLRRIGLRKTLVFYKGRAPNGQKSDWIMHEYRLDESFCDSAGPSSTGDLTPEEGWVVCRVFRKRNYQKTLDSTKSMSATAISTVKMHDTANEGSVLDQILVYMGRANCWKTPENHDQMENAERSMMSSASQHDVDPFLHLPRLDESPYTPLISTPLITGAPATPLDHQTICHLKTCHQTFDEIASVDESDDQLSSRIPTPDHEPKSVDDIGTSDWVVFDRLVALQLNGQLEFTASNHSSYPQALNLRSCPGPSPAPCDQKVAEFSQVRVNRLNQIYDGEDDFNWNFAKSPCASPLDPLHHLSG